MKGAYMKPIFATDITEDKNNEAMPADEFVGARVSEACAAELDRLNEKNEEIVEKAKPPLSLRIATWVLGAGALLTLLFLTTALEELEFKSFFERFSGIIVLFLILLGAWILCNIFSAKYVKKILSTPESLQAVNATDNALLNAFHELGVPEDAKEADILHFSYKMKNGEAVFKSQGLLANVYINLPKKIYAEDGVLFLADGEHRYDFKISDMRAIRTVKKRIALFDWNKDEEYNKGEYKQYRISKDDNNDVYYIKPYHILEMVVNGEELGIYFPAYELPIFEELTGLRATEE